MKKKIIILIFLSLVFSFILFPLKAKAQNTGGCIVYNSGIYPATYSFTNELDDTIDDNIGWVDIYGGTDSNPQASIVGIEDGHSKVMKVISDGDNGAYFLWRHEISQIIITIEIWIKYIDNGQGRHDIYFSETGGVNDLFYGQFNSIGNTFAIYYGNGVGGQTSLFIDVFSNTWYRLRFNLNSITNIGSCWVNDVLLISAQPFINDRDPNIINNYRVLLQDGDGNNALEMYVDAIGESWDVDYNIGDNRFPLSVNQGAYQPMLAFFILIILMSLMFLLYMKVKKPELLILVVFLFSLIIGIGALMNCDIPFTPYLQIFFILFQSVIFILASLNYYEKQKKKRY